jgi:proteic killer suppression protein
LTPDIEEITFMITSFRSRTLKRFWERSDASKLPAQDVARIGRILDLLDIATEPKGMDLPGYHFHPLKGDMAGRYAVTVRANWRITFAWAGQDAIEVDYEDYH